MSMWNLYEQYWLPFGQLLTDMEQQGIKIDVKLLKKIVTEAKVSVRFFFVFQHEPVLRKLKTKKKQFF